MTIYYTTIHYKLPCHLWIWHFLIAVNPCWHHYSDVIMSVTASQITSVSVVCSTVCSGADQRKDQNSTSLAFVRGIHRWPVNSPHKGPVIRKIFFIWWRHHDYILDTFCLTYCLWIDVSIFCQFTDTPRMKKKPSRFTHFSNTLTDNLFVSNSAIYLIWLPSSLDDSIKNIFELSQFNYI